MLNAPIKDATTPVRIQYKIGLTYPHDDSMNLSCALDHIFSFRFIIGIFA